MAAKRGALSRARVLEGALALVEREGLEGLSMRKLGDELGVEAMALYRHVANKSDLFDGIFETVLARMALPARTGDWREDVRALARAFRDVLAAHPRALPLFASRPAVTDASLEAVEAALDVLVRAGFPLEEALLLFQALVALVVGHGLAHYAPAEPSRPVDYPRLDPARFPHLRRIVPVLQAYGPEDELELALDVFVAGLEQRLA